MVLVVSTCSPVVETVCGDEQGSHRGPALHLPQADGHRQAAHVCGDGVCTIRVSAAGEAVHAAHHHQDLQHAGGPGDPQTVL